MRTFLLLLCLLWLSAAEATTGFSIKRFGRSDHFPQSLITNVVQDDNGLVWLASWNGLLSYDGHYFREFKAQPGDGSPLESNRIDFVLPSGHNKLLCLSLSKVYEFDELSRRFRLATPQQSRWLRQNYIVYRAPDSISRRIAQMEEYRGVNYRILLVDYQEGVWVDSHRGLERITRDRPTVGPVKFGTATEEMVRGLYQDRQGRVWMADKNGYVRIIGHGRTLFLSPSGQMVASPVRFGPSVYAILEDREGDFWFGCKPGGLYRLTRQGRLAHYYHSAADRFSLSDDEVYALSEDQRGRIIVATYHGGVNFGERTTGGSVRFYNAGNQLRHYPREALASRSLLMVGGKLLIGTKQGLFTADPTQSYADMVFHRNVRRPLEASSLSNNYVTDICRAADGTIYVATLGGGVDRILSRQLLSDTISFSHYSVVTGLASDQCLSLSADRKGNVWVVSDASLCCLNTHTGLATSYLADYFSGQFAFVDAKPLCLPSGDICLGTTQGVLVFNQLRAGKSNFTPRIALNCPDTITLGPDNPNFRLHFAALDFNQREGITYAYRLEGVDSTWHYTRSNELNYVGLAPGTYRLHLRSTNGDGVWVSNDHIVIIHRKASFNETPVAWMLYGGLVLLIIICVAIVARYIIRLQKELNHTRLTSNQKIELMGEQIKELLIRGDAEHVDVDEEGLDGADRQLADRVRQIVADNIGNSSFSIKEFSQQLGMCRTQLYVNIKNLFDTTPNNYLLNVRILHSQKLLRNQHATISEVAYGCGFTDPRYFSRCFRKITGMTPSDYRKSLEGKQG